MGGGDICWTWELFENRIKVWDRTSEARSDVAWAQCVVIRDIPSKDEHSDISKVGNRRPLEGAVGFIDNRRGVGFVEDR